MKRLALLPLILTLLSCKWSSSDDQSVAGESYRNDMRSFVVQIANYARQTDPGFQIVPQNGIELITDDGNSDGDLMWEYFSVLNGVGQEDLFYGYENDNEATPAGESQYLLEFLARVRDNGRRVLSTDYCWSIGYVDQSFTLNDGYGFISFAADHRGLNDIPDYPNEPYHWNLDSVANLSQAKNFLYLINPGDFGDGDGLVAAVSQTDYDCVIVDAFVDGVALTPEQVQALKLKHGGGQRLVIAYMSIGEAEDYRYYWNDDWYANPPAWMDLENPDWPGNYKVRYWDPEWQAIICGSQGAYLDRLLAAGFDGAYLDIVDAFEYFEETR
jgi:cysteinyl-tRNA synthetase, unknown class